MNMFVFLQVLTYFTALFLSISISNKIVSFIGTDIDYKIRKQPVIKLTVILIFILTSFTYGSIHIMLFLFWNILEFITNIPSI